MRIYLAARWGRREELQHYARRLVAAGHAVTSSWLWTEDDDRDPDPKERRRWALRNESDLRDSDAIVAFADTPEAPGAGRGGRHVEFGMAIAFGLRLVLVGEPEHVFHYTAGVTVVADFEAALEALR